MAAYAQTKLREGASPVPHVSCTHEHCRGLQNLVASKSSRLSQKHHVACRPLANKKQTCTAYIANLAQTMAFGMHVAPSSHYNKCITSTLTVCSGLTDRANSASAVNRLYKTSQIKIKINSSDTGISFQFTRCFRTLRNRRSIQETMLSDSMPSSTRVAHAMQAM